MISRIVNNYSVIHSYRIATITSSTSCPVCLSARQNEDDYIARYPETCTSWFALRHGKAEVTDQCPRFRQRLSLEYPKISLNPGNQ